jgi:RNA polymerase sigma factor for flagellar operon FliA
MYTAKGTLNRDDQLRKYSPLVRRLAHHMIAKLPPSVELDDLIQVGMIGLTEAIARFEPTQGVQFETFASQRIRGAMIDELREGDWMSRGSRKSQKDIEQAVNRLQQKLHRAPKESEIAEEMGMSLADYQHLLAKVRGTQLVYLEDIRAAATTKTVSWTATWATTKPTPQPCCRTTACAPPWWPPSRCCPTASRRSCRCTTSTT